jgi:hypothetical protein
MFEPIKVTSTVPQVAIKTKFGVKPRSITVITQLTHFTKVPNAGTHRLTAAPLLPNFQRSSCEHTEQSSRSLYHFQHVVALPQREGYFLVRTSVSPSREWDCKWRYLSLSDADRQVGLVVL